jgi:serine/threonine protein kinase
VWSETVTPAIAAGTRFGRYTLVRQLAVGGMAEIYLARADGIGQFAKQVVLKRILPQHARSEDFVEMFLHEARLAATLEHPNIVQVFDIGELDGSYFFTMEYVQGEDLRTLLGALRKRNERMPIDHAIAIVTAAAAGLHYAHDRVGDDGRPLAMVHRDISPSNIMVSLDGAVKVTDFGIAKTASQLIETRTGVLKGKISYMSPEQCKSEPLDRRSDIFSLGIVLHELATGQKLFRGDNDYAILRKIIEDDAPTLSAVVDGPYPDGLEAIVARALARDRDARYPTAQALQIELENLAREQRLDRSSVALSRYVRETFPAAAAPAPDADSQTPATTPIPRPATGATVLEQPQSSSAVIGELHRPPPRARARWLVGAGAAALLASGIGIVAMSRPGHDDDVPAVAPPRPAIEATAVVDAAVADAPRVAEPAPPPTPAATPPAATPTPVVVEPPRPPPRKPPVRDTHPRPRPTPTPPRDPCLGWNPNSLSPPPAGCDPK